MARIVFDLDGTLIDSAQDILELANRVLAEDGKGPLSLKHVNDFMGHGTPSFVESMRQAVGLPDSEQERILARYRVLYDDAVKLTDLYPGARDALGRLSAEGHVLGICTNKPTRPCMSVLRHLDLGSTFAEVICGDSLKVHKPDPAPLFATFNAMGEGEQIYVGDSEVDAETARRAGVPFLLFTEGYRKSPIEEIPNTATFSHFDELPGLVARTLAAVS
ncbi:phosphoglycolate phosphatase [uncultured Cohaesibacter sp.]|uniref:phosphoglycolate phosphatase n=1 Tax=uncultured Cohaesibacter sp. TaxID=1002546 RepID=UPI0029C98313|nr:phosphoglycolate phosphatase [uncultured Cohaesibacter sp.]